MRNFKQIILLLSIFMMAVPVSGNNTCNVSDENDEESNVDIDLIIDNNKGSNPIGRPKSGSLQQIDCHYTSGTLFIQFAISEGNCELTVIDTETGDSKIYYFDSFSPAFINIGNLNSFKLFITTEKGNSYYGNK